MGAWGHLIEARIRDWQERKQRGDEQPREPSDPADSLESQLFEEVVKLRRRARVATDPAQQRALLAEAERVRIRLSVVLEQYGFHLLAASLDQRIAAELGRTEPTDE